MVVFLWFSFGWSIQKNYKNLMTSSVYTIYWKKETAMKNYSPGTKCLLLKISFTPCEKDILHLKEVILHPQSENPCRPCQFLVAFEI